MEFTKNGMIMEGCLKNRNLKKVCFLAYGSHGTKMD